MATFYLSKIEALGREDVYIPMGVVVQMGGEENKTLCSLQLALGEDVYWFRLTDIVGEAGE